MIKLLKQISNKLSYLRGYLVKGDILAFASTFSGDWIEAEENEESFTEKIKKEIDAIRQELVKESEPSGEDVAYESKVVRAGFENVEKVA